MLIITYTFASTSKKPKYLKKGEIIKLMIELVQVDIFQCKICSGGLFVAACFMKYHTLIIFS